MAIYMAKAWHLIVPVGEFPHPKGVVQVIDRASVDAMAHAFDPSRKVLVDFDHYSDLTNDQRDAVKAAKVLLPSDAAGWVTAVRATAKGLAGEIDFTPAGDAALGNRSYRFLSPVFLGRDVESDGEGRVRPLRLAKVGLTNEPNMTAIPALANRGEDEQLIGPAVDCMANRMDKEQGEKMDYKAKLCNALNLDPAKATDEEIDAAITARKAKDDESAAKVAEGEEMANRVKKLESAALKVRVDAALSEHAGVIANRADIESALTADFDGTIKTLRALKLATLPNRADGDLPDGDIAAKDAARTKFIEEVKLSNRCATNAQAWEIAQRHKPELFK